MVYCAMLPGFLAGSLGLVGVMTESELLRTPYLVLAGVQLGVLYVPVLRWLAHR